MCGRSPTRPLSLSHTFIRRVGVLQPSVLSSAKVPTHIGSYTAVLSPVLLSVPESTPQPLNEAALAGPLALTHEERRNAGGLIGGSSRVSLPVASVEWQGVSGRTHRL